MLCPKPWHPQVPNISMSCWAGQVQPAMGSWAMHLAASQPAGKLVSLRTCPLSSTLLLQSCQLAVGLNWAEHYFRLVELWWLLPAMVCRDLRPPQPTELRFGKILAFQLACVEPFARKTMSCQGAVDAAFSLLGLSTSIR